MPAIRGSKSVKKTRRNRRALDQVHADIRSPKHLAQYKDTKAKEDLPGLGEFYCVACAKWFEAENNLVQHRRGKPHKRRLKLLKDKPYSQKEAEAAVGLSTDNGSRPETMELDNDSPDMDVAQSHQQPIESDDEEEYHAFFSAL